MNPVRLDEAAQKARVRRTLEAVDRCVGLLDDAWNVWPNRVEASTETTVTFNRAITALDKARRALARERNDFERL